MLNSSPSNSATCATLLQGQLFNASNWWIGSALFNPLCWSTVVANRLGTDWQPWSIDSATPHADSLVRLRFRRLRGFSVLV